MDYEQNFNLKLVPVGYRVVYVWIDFFILGTYIQHEFGIFAGFLIL